MRSDEWTSQKTHLDKGADDAVEDNRQTEAPVSFGQDRQVAVVEHRHAIQVYPETQRMGRLEQPVRMTGE